MTSIAVLLPYMLVFSKIVTHCQSSTECPQRIHRSARDADRRIVGGYECSPKDHPFVVNLFCLGSSYCGGVLIRLDWVLTAAHCIDPSDPDNCLVRVGFKEPPDLVQHSFAKKVIRHPKYVHASIDETQELRYDIGLILLQQAFKPSPVSVTVKLPTPDYSMNCSSVKIMGAGITTPQKPRRDLAKALICVDVKVAPLKDCRRKYVGKIDESIFCTYERNKDACYGDSGGPLICKDTLVALVSAGLGCASGYPSINTNVTSYLGFINSNLAKYKSGSCRNRFLCVFLALTVANYLKSSTVFDYHIIFKLLNQ